MDSYQAIFDAVRSRISNGDVGMAVIEAIKNVGLDHYASLASMAAQDVVWEQKRPSVLFRPKLSKDGDSWCALLGDDLQVGCAGFGDTPEKAMIDFDRAFKTEKG